MEPRKLINFLNTIEKLKCNTRHSWTSSGRHESVAEHSWRCAVMAMLCAEEYPDIDINKVIKMCLIHDFGESITGDIPAFAKTAAHESTEKTAVSSLIALIPEANLDDLFAEMNEMKSGEAKLFKALDKLEALISHNEADISTWTPLEYELNLTYGDENCTWSKYTHSLREEIRKDSLSKIDINKSTINSYN